MILNNKHFTVKILTFAALLLTSSCTLTESTGNAGSSDQGDYFDETFLRSKDHIYQPNIATVMAYRKGFEQSLPTVYLNDPESILEVRFDDLYGGIRNYYYKIILCDHNWNIINKPYQEYLEGYQEHPIQDYKVSFNTIVRYTHYRFELPNKDIRFRHSGNFLVVGFDMDTDELLFSKRIMVAENLMNMQSDIHFTDVVSQRFYQQEVDFTVDAGNFSIVDPFRNLNASIIQNHRWDNAVHELKPQFVESSKYIYDLSDRNIFNGINEFRLLDIRSFMRPAPNVSTVKRDSLYEFKLARDMKRSFKRYLTIEDINGDFSIMAERADDPHLEADYFLVEFELETNGAIDSGDVYIAGDFSNWRALPEYRMQYDATDGVYKTSLLLKQGYYNYMYALWNDDDSHLNVAAMEGNHSETENNYTILVYYYDMALDADRLIGVHSGNSIEQNE